MKRYIFIILLAGLSSFSSALADDLDDCRKIDSDLQRLACYDQIGISSEQVISPTKSSNQDTTLEVNNQKLIEQKPRPTSPISESYTNTSKKKNIEEEFGLEKVSPADAIDTINTSILGEFTGWEKDTIFKLANGQIWKLSSSSSRPVYRRSINNPKVTIKKGFLNSYKMKVAGVNSTVKVKRVK